MVEVGLSVTPLASIGTRFIVWYISRQASRRAGTGRKGVFGRRVWFTIIWLAVVAWMDSWCRL
jgi:hypothetical protein